MTDRKLTDGDRIADAIRDTLISPNVSDSNFEAANIVDALASVAAAIRRVAKAIEESQAAVAALRGKVEGQ